MNRLLVALCLLLLPSSLAAQGSLLGDVQAERAKYGPSMTREQVAQLLNAVAWNHRLEGWGLLRKGSGNSCPLGDTFVSCDILVHAPTVQHFDVLRDAENTAVPQWGLVGPCVLGPSSGCDMSNFIAPTNPAGGTSAPAPTPSQPPGPTTSADVDALLGLIADHDKATQERDERIFANLTAQIQEIKALVLAIPSTPVAPVSAPLQPNMAADTGGSAWAFIAKYVLPAVGGVLAGMQATK
jgi:hypothetical protein